MGFEEKVWFQLKRIPKGKVTTYSAVARAVGKPNAARAVGNACGKNPLAPRVPCHRVVKSNGEVGGYSKGTKKKISLLKKDGIPIKNGKIVGFEKRLFKQ